MQEEAHGGSGWETRACVCACALLGLFCQGVRETNCLITSPLSFFLIPKDLMQPCPVSRNVSCQCCAQCFKVLEQSFLMSPKESFPDCGDARPLWPWLEPPLISPLTHPKAACVIHPSPVPHYAYTSFSSSHSTTILVFIFLCF